MLDMNLIRENPQWVKEGLKKKNVEADFTDVLNWDKEKRGLMTETENLKAKKNKVSAQIPVMKKNGEDVSELFF
jgi:seryl-tRNA synthetase